MVRELDFSKITLRLIEHIDKKGEGNESHVLAKLAGNTLETLTRCLVREAVLQSSRANLAVHSNRAHLER